MGAFDELLEKVATAKDVATVEGEAVQGLFQQLGAAMAPLPEAISAVKTAAAQLALGWG